MLSCHVLFTNAFTAIDCAFKVITLVETKFINNIITSKMQPNA